MLLLYRRILKAAKLFPSVKREAIIHDIRREFREHKVGRRRPPAPPRPPPLQGCAAGRGSRSALQIAMCLPAAHHSSPAAGALSPWPPRPASLAQALSDPAKLRHELGVALRSLEQLEQYAGLSTAGSEELAVSLKGSCD